MDRWIELSRIYREALCTAPTFEDALGRTARGFEAGSGTLPDLGAARATLLGWFDDIRLCDLGEGVDIVHVELGDPPQTFEISAWRWADRIMFIDDGLIEPDSVRMIMAPGRTHSASELAVPFLSDPRLWLLFSSFVPLERLENADLKSLWGIDREFGAVFALRDAVFHGGFVTPTGWKRPLRLVEPPEH